MSKHTDLALRGIVGNLTATTTSVTAWYVLPPKSWSFTSEGRRADVVLETARRLSRLRDVRGLHYRVTSRPYPVAEWAKQLDATTRRTAGRRDLGSGWVDYLTAAQKGLLRQTMDEKVVYLGVPLPARTLFDRVGDKLVERGLSKRERDDARRRAAEITEVVAGPGMDAEPATVRDVEWLVHRSVGLLMPPPPYLSAGGDEPWSEGDLGAFTDGITYHVSPFDRAVRITDSRRTGDPVERWVSVLTLGRTATIDLPNRDDPWMARSDRLPFPVEWSARFDVLAGKDATEDAKRAMRLVRDLQKGYAEHGEDIPLDLEEKARRAAIVQNEMTDGEQIVSTRLHGWVRAAVSGATRKECLTNARKLRDLYEPIHFTLEHPTPGQYPLMREFTPGEPLGGTAYKRRMPVQFAASAVPQATAAIGDRVGHNIGRVAQNNRPTMFDLHRGPEIREASGFIPAVGEQGSGKSGIMGDLGYVEAISWVTSTILDPGGPLAGLCTLPELKGRSRHLDLLHGAPGSLNPATVVADPSRELFPGDDEFHVKVQEARADRRALMLDVALQLLPYQIATLPQTRTVVWEAAHRTSGERSSSLRELVDRLRELDDPYGGKVANMLEIVADMPQASLFFPQDVTLEDDEHDDTLLVLTMEGLALPDPHQPAESRTMQEQVAQPLLHLATFYATRRIYGLPKWQRKFIGLDEVGQMGRWGSGHNLFAGLARQSRKWNAAVLASSQNPEDVLGLNVSNFIDAAFVGRILNEKVAAHALTELLRLPAGEGYESVLAGLSPQPKGGGRRQMREFVMRLGEDREKVRIEIPPHVLAAIDSTPSGSTAAAPPVAVPA